MLSDLLVFATGLGSIPPLGIEPVPTLVFRYPDDMKSESTAGFPLANTCANILHIPVMQSYAEFAANMTAAITQVKTFTET